MRWTVGVVALLLAMPALAQTGSGIHAVDDPDDGREISPQNTVDGSYCLLLPSPARLPCVIGASAASFAPNEGTPAPASMEILAAHVDANASHVRFAIDVAELDAGLTGVFTEDTTYALHGVRVGSGSTASFGEEREEPYEVAVYFIWTSDGATVAPKAYLFGSGPDMCARKAPSCFYPADLSLTFGQPGRMEASVERAMLPGQDLTHDMHDLEAISMRYDQTEKDGLSYQAGGLVSGFSFSEKSTVYDGLEAIVDGPITKTPRSPSALPSATSWSDPEGDIMGRYHPGHDITGLDITEADGFIRFHITTRDTPSDEVEYNLGFHADGRESWIVATRNGDAMAVSGSICTEIEYWCEYTALPATGLAVGNQATIVVATSDLDLPAGDGVLTSIVALAHKREHREHANVGVASVEQSGGAWDILSATNYLVGSEGTLRPPSLALRFTDDLGDVALPTLVEHTDPGPSGRFDIVALEFAPGQAGDYIVNLEIADLASGARVPTGYEAMVYATGLRTDNGDFLVGYYKEADAPAAPFCSQDNLVFADTPGDPRDALGWRIIQGLVTQGGGQFATSTGSRIALIAPEECFGLTGAPGLNISAAKSAVYLMEDRGPLGRTVSEPVDDMAVSESFQIIHPEETLVAARPSAWYNDPFGIDSFWDITGVAAALAAALVGAWLAGARRRRSQAWIKRIDEAKVMTEPAARESALHLIKKGVQDAAAAGRLTEGQAVLLERRIDDVLGSARVESLGEAFGELPFALLKRLEQMLADGIMDPVDYKTFSAMLEDTSLTAPARARVRRKLRAWVEQDT